MPPTDMVVFDQIRRKDYRLGSVAVFLLMAMGVLMAGLWYVQIFSSSQYIESQRNQSMRTVRIPSVRGKIFDQHGRILAEDKPAYNLSAYLEELRPHFRKAWRENRPKRKLDAEESLQLQIQTRYQVVSNFINRARLNLPLDVNAGEIQRHFSELRALPLPVLKNLDPANVARFMELSDRIPGLDIQAWPTRHYPEISVAHLVGHLKKDNTSEEESTAYNYRLPDFRGVIGFEQTFDNKLRGHPGTRSMLVNHLGYRQSENLEVPTQPGSHVHLTLDLEIQKVAYDAMKASGHKAGAAVVMDVNNGDLIALTSMPVFDPNDFIPAINPQKWAQYRDARPSPLLFRATQERYPPGSIFKIISGLAALESGVVNTNDFMYNPGHYRLGRRNIDDTAPAGDYNFKKAFKYSSNTYFIHHGLSCGIEQIVQMGNQFFLGQRTGLLPRQEVAGQFPTLGEVRNGWRDGDTANIAIGQGRITVTPLQMGIMTAAVANGGRVFWPRLVARVEPADPDAFTDAMTFPQGRIRGQLRVTPRNLAAVQHAMWADVHEEGGTGKRAMIDDYAVCGKTGTAEIRGGGRRDKITWFSSYAPYKQPRYAVVVMIESGVSGGKTCAPIAKKIFEALRDRDRRSPRTPLANN
ncbi:MAG: hypothetical protein CMO74_05070 [Verrucomicrobiales bacterium]|nr:hypothetical protein [Verrucomicrobiales bacterium]